MRFLKSGFFHQTTPPGPTGDVLEPFSSLANFRGVMYILKRLPVGRRLDDEGIEANTLYS